MCWGSGRGNLLRDLFIRPILVIRYLVDLSKLRDTVRKFVVHVGD